MSKPRTKAPTLTLNMMKNIALYKAQNPDISAAAVAKHFNVTIHQVNYAVRQTKAGKIVMKKTSKVKTAQALFKMKDDGYNKLFEEQTHYILAQLSVDEHLDHFKRVTVLEKIAKARKIQTEQEMQVHLKGMDWDIYAMTIRRFMPNASDKEIIRLFNEIKDRVNVEKQLQQA